ncbi:MAG: aminotransferase [bacterium]|nr:aminotransferase [bacterium]
MEIKAFQVEEWMNAYETTATYNLAETCVDSISLQTLFEMVGIDKMAFFDAFSRKRMTYGDIEGKPEFLEGICGLYRNVLPEHIVTTHGAAGANHLLISSLVEAGDKVISVMPTYQQLYSIPESIGADVQILHLKKENGYLPDLEELRRMAVPGTKLICINNPNNPSGALMQNEMLREIVEIARDAGAYLLCDEVYRHLNQEDGYIESIVDLYEKGISVSSMSKVFSLAGLRLGWIVTKDAALKKQLLSHRDYCLISCGMFDEAIAAVALKHADKILARSRSLIQKNLEILDTWVQKEPHISYVKPKAGTTALLHYEGEMDSVTFCKQMLDETGVFMTPGDCFGEEKCARIGYACSSEDLTVGLEKMSEYLKKTLK